MNSNQSVKSTTADTAETLLKPIINNLLNKNFKMAFELVQKAQPEFIRQKSYKNISICLSLFGLLEYLNDKTKYFKALTSLNEGRYLAETVNNVSAKLISEFATAEIEFNEGNIQEASLHYESAKIKAKEKDRYGLLNTIEMKISNIQNPSTLPKKRDPLLAMIKIGQAISAETNIDILLKVIAEETKIAIQADRCSVFLYDKKNHELWSKVALGMNSNEIRFPVEKGLAGHVVKTGETINIKDAYSDKRFNNEIDKKTGYKTKTILCMPIKNLNQQIIGAFQVLNKIEGTFNEEDEDLLLAIGSNAGIALENAQLFKQQKEMIIEQKQVFDSFIDTLAASIDARDKITSGHSTRVRLYSGLIARQLKLNSKMIEIIETAATLHDIGKIGIKDSVLQKEGKLTDEEYKHIQKHVEITHTILERIHMSDDFKLVTEIACSHHEKYNGTGYYRHLSGENIPFGGRILAVSDVFDAITSKRHYRDKMPIDNVIRILLNDSGTHFDKMFVDCFLSIPSDKIVKVFLTENHLKLQDEDRLILEKYCLLDLYKLLTEKNQDEMSSEDLKFLDIFKFYYSPEANKDLD